ncbi:acyltransferase family protein [Enterobacter mori]|uniref:acyltransferase family protein n=1 Tax=Enterobacter mori TaxID=539813 RepID=UPI003D6DFFD3
MIENQGKIYFIEVLRGFAALLVVGYHIAGVLMGAYDFWPGMGRDLFRNGNIGVDIFFMISGFIICYATKNKEENYRSNFIIRRFFRIYPLFFICLTIAWLTYNSGYDYTKYLLSATLMQNNYAGKAPFYDYNMLYPAWTIAYEVMFYFIFFISMCFSHRYRSVISMLLLAFLMCAIQLFFKGELSIYGGFSPYDERMGFMAPALTLLGSPLMIEFVIGMICFHVFNTGLLKHRKYLANIFLMACITSMCLLYFMNLNMHGMTEKGIVAALIFITMMLSEMSGKKINLRVTKFFSDISYSLYITHAMILKYYINYLHSIGEKDYPKGLLSFFAIYIVCILVAYVSHITIERWFIGIGKSLITKLRCKESKETALNV